MDAAARRVNPRATGWLALATVAIAGFVYFYEIRGEPGRRAAAESEALLFPGIEPADVTALWIKRPDEPESRARRAAGGWELVEPRVGPGDPATLDAMARVLSQLRSQGRIEDPADPGVYGLDEGAILVSFSAGPRSRGLRIGRETPLGPNVYVGLVASADAPEAIHMVSSAQASVFDRGADALRDRRVLPLRPDAIRRVEIESADGLVVLEGGPDGWVIASPERLPADDAKVSRLLEDLSVLRADSFVEDGVLDVVDMRFRLQEGAGSAATTLALGPVEEGVRLARGRDDRLYRVRDGLVAHLPTSVESLRAPAEVPPAAEELTSPR